MNPKLLFINPAGSHNVFKGWQYFLDKYFDLHNYNHGDKEGQFGKYHELKPSRIIILFKNFIALYDQKYFKIGQDDTVVIGDIFTNSLCYLLKKGNLVYYSEFFDFRKNLIKKILFYLIGWTLFRKKKFIVPTIMARKTFLKISPKVFYLPQIYYGKILEGAANRDEKINLLFVGRISQKFKNTDFLIQNYLCLKEAYPNIHLRLVGEVFDTDFDMKHAEAIDNGDIEILGKKSTEELDEIYCTSHIFILPSNSDPIGAVVQEAMAHGCAILVSDTVGAGCYVLEGKNGYVFETNNSADFQKKIQRMLDDKLLLNSFRNQSCKIIRDCYWYENGSLLEQLNADLNSFIKK